MKQRVRIVGCVWLCGALFGCSSANTFTLRPTTPLAVESLPTPQLAQGGYRRVLLLPPEAGVSIAPDMQSNIVGQHDTRYFIGQLEKVMLGKGFEVISPEVVARAGAGKHSAIERAMIMGKETKADALLSVQSISAVPGEKFFDGRDLKEVEPGLRVSTDDGYVHKETEVCLFRVPFYELRAEAKLIDLQTGDVLWVGSVRENTLDTLRESWVAKLDDECEIEEESPFLYKDYLAEEATLARTTSALFDRLVSPLRGTLSGGVRKREPEVAETAPPPPPPPPVAPAPEPEVKPKVALVSSPKASLRETPDQKARRMSFVPRKAKVEVIETMGVWIRVKVQDGTTGWIHESNLILPES